MHVEFDALGLYVELHILKMHDEWRVFALYIELQLFHYLCLIKVFILF